MTESVLLVGYMGSGKTKIGKKIAKKLSLDFYDLDSEIENEFSIPISKIFDKIGELSFRKIEKSKLEKILSFKKPFVLSVGGGTPCYNNNLGIINSNNNISIYLKNNNIDLSKRLYKNKNDRPLISGIESEEKMVEFVSKHLFEREFYYNRAIITIDCYNKDFKTICDLIISNLD